MVLVVNWFPKHHAEWWILNRRNLWLLAALCTVICSGFLLYCYLCAASATSIVETLLILFCALFLSGIGLFLLLSRRYTWLVVSLVGLHVYVDWYLGYHLLAPLLALAFLVFLHRFTACGRRPAMCWCWILFLLVTLYPAWVGGRLMLYDAASFYPSDILGAFFFYWLGGIVAHDRRTLRSLLSALTLLSIILALHLYIQAWSGVVLLQSSRVDAFLAQDDVAYYQLLNSSAHRVGSFFIDPNWAGAYFALSFFLPAGLALTSSSFLFRIFYFCAALFLLGALTLTYSTGAWCAFLVGSILFLWLCCSFQTRFICCCCVFFLLLFLFWSHPLQFQLQLQHMTANNELSLRIAAWETAVRVACAYPWTGVGLGHQAYLLRAEPYRVPAQFVPLSHPHDSYLELAAMGGFPVLLIFCVLVIWALVSSYKSWLLADRATRPIVGSGIVAVVTLSVNSISINGWTHFALALFGWLILGAVSQCRF